MKRYAARAALILIVIAALLTMAAIRVRHQEVWPFPPTDHLLPAFAEIALWALTIVAVIAGASVVIFKLLVAAGWVDLDPEGGDQ